MLGPHTQSTDLYVCLHFDKNAFGHQHFHTHGRIIFKTQTHHSSGMDRAVFLRRGVGALPPHVFDRLVYNNIYIYTYIYVYYWTPWASPMDARVHTRGAPSVHMYIGLCFFKRRALPRPQLSHGPPTLPKGRLWMQPLSTCRLAQARARCPATWLSPESRRWRTS